MTRGKKTGPEKKEKDFLKKEREGEWKENQDCFITQESY